MPITSNHHFSIDLPGRPVIARVWKAQVGACLFICSIPTTNSTSDEDRSITHMLYGGNWENRLKQEMLLGLGGIRMLNELNMQTTCTTATKDMPHY
jgi:glycogen phosphorylase/synthase